MFLAMLYDFWVNNVSIFSLTHNFVYFLLLEATVYVMTTCTKKFVFPLVNKIFFFTNLSMFFVS